MVCRMLDPSYQGHGNSAISRITATDLAYQLLRRDIVTVTLEPGERVTERQLIDRLGGTTSKTPIRDALGRLRQDNLVEQTPGRGWRITPITLDDTRDLFSFRMLIERSAVARAVGQTTPEQLDAAGASLSASYDPDDPESITRFIHNTNEVHVGVARASGSPSLERALLDVLGRLERLLYLMLRSKGTKERVAAEHGDLIRLVSSGTPEAADAAIVEHLTRSQEMIMEALLDLAGAVELPPRPIDNAHAGPRSGVRHPPPELPGQCLTRKVI